MHLTRQENCTSNRRNSSISTSDRWYPKLTGTLGVPLVRPISCASRSSNLTRGFPLRKFSRYPFHPSGNNQMTPNETAELYGVSRITVLRWITHGVSGIRLNATRLGGRWRITREDCETFHACVTDAANREREKTVRGNSPVIARKYRGTGKAAIANRVKAARGVLNN